MPKGAGGGDANANRLIMFEKREREIERGKRRLARVRNAAERAISPLKPQQRIFYHAYYIEALKISAAQAEARISERTAIRYLKEVRTKKETGD